VPGTTTCQEIKRTPIRRLYIAPTVQNSLSYVRPFKLHA
jgi:hypothetical protein